jgi:flagellar assembly factor FliW
MQIETQRFGNIRLDHDQLFVFPSGLIGMETLRDWALLPDDGNPAVAWLQSASRGDRALPLISPRAFFDDYRVQVARRELAALHIRPGSELFVLTTVSGHSGKLTTNLRSPILLNLSRRLGCQVITDNAQPLQQSVSSPKSERRSTALGSVHDSTKVLVPASDSDAPGLALAATLCGTEATLSAAVTAATSASLVQQLRRAA